MGRLPVSPGGASEENSGGAAEQQPVHGDPQRERRVRDWAGGERTGPEGARYESLRHFYTRGLMLPCCLHPLGGGSCSPLSYVFFSRHRRSPEHVKIYPHVEKSVLKIGCMRQISRVSTDNTRNLPQYPSIVNVSRWFSEVCSSPPADEFRQKPPRLHRSWLWGRFWAIFSPLLGVLHLFP